MKRPAFDGAHLLVIDVETTGLVEDEWARVVEVGAVLFDPWGAEQDTFSALVRPSIFDPEQAAEALRINGIAPADILDALPEAAVAEALGVWLTRVRQRAPVAFYAWGAEFEEAMLARMGVTLALCCAMGWACQSLTRGDRPRMRLVDAAADLGVPVPAHLHRALADARLAGRVLFALETRDRRSAAGRKGRRESERLLQYVREGRRAWRAAEDGRPTCTYVAGSAEARAWARGVEQAREWADQHERTIAWRASAERLAAELGATLRLAGVQAVLSGGELDEQHELRLASDAWELAERRHPFTLLAGGALHAGMGTFDHRPVAAAARFHLRRAPRGLTGETPA